METDGDNAFWTKLILALFVLCCASGDRRPPQRARRIRITAWIGMVLALVAAGLARLVSAR